jgi:hypothetical protein
MNERVNGLGRAELNGVRERKFMCGIVAHGAELNWRTENSCFGMSRACIQTLVLSPYRLSNYFTLQDTSLLRS